MICRTAFPAPGGSRGEHDIAGHGDVCAGACSDAINGADDWFRHRPETAYDWVVKAIHGGPEIDFGARLPIVQILAGAKPATFACEQHRAAHGVLGDSAELLKQRDAHLLVEGVEPIGAVEDDLAPAVGQLRSDAWR